MLIQFGFDYSAFPICQVEQVLDAEDGWKMEKIHLGLLSSNSQESKSRTAAWEMGQMALARKRRRIAKGVSPATGSRRCIRCADMY